MIGNIYYKILNSSFGERFFKISFGDDSICWSEKGVSRFIFWNCLVMFGAFFSVVSYAGGFSFRYVISALVISLYLKEKFSELFAKVLDEVNKIDVEMSPPIEESRGFKIMERIMKGDDVSDIVG